MNMFVSQQSELMKNHLPGSSLPAFEIVYGTTDDKGFPLLFGFDRVDGKFVVIVRSIQSTTGWEMVDLGAQIAKSDRIVACDVAQKPDGTIRIAAYIDNKATGYNAIAYADALNPYSTPDAWKDVGPSFKKLMGSGSTPEIDGVRVSSDDRESEYIAVEGSLNGVRNTWFSRIVPDGLNRQVPQIDGYGVVTSRPGVLYQTVDGRKQGLYGYYTLYRDKGGYSSKVYFCEPQDTDTLYPVEFNVALNSLDTISTAIANDVDFPDGTILTGFADGALFTWTPQILMSEGHPIVSTRPTQLPQKAAGLVMSTCPMRADKNTFVVTVDGSLHHFLSPINNEKVPPLVIAGGGSEYGVKSCSAWRVPGKNPNDCSLLTAIGYGDGTLELRSQDCVSGQWQIQHITLEAPRHATYHEMVSSMTVHLIITDEFKQPVANQTIGIKPEYGCTAYINEKLYHFTGEDFISVTTDVVGKINITLPSHSIQAPTWEIQAAPTQRALKSGLLRQSGPSLSKFNPCRPIRDRVANIKTASDITAAKSRSTGKPIFDTPPDDSQIENALRGLELLNGAMTALDSGRLKLCKSGDFHTMRGTLVRTTSIRFTSSGPVVKTQTGAKAAQSVHDSDFNTEIGNLFEFLFSVDEQELEEIVWGLNEYAPGLVSFFVTIGDFTYEAVVATGNALLEAADFVLQYSLGINIDQVIDWLGYLFDWDDILLTHRAMKSAVNVSLVSGARQLQASPQQLIKNALDDFINPNIGLPLPELPSEFSKYVNSTPKQLSQGRDDMTLEGSDSANSNWGHSKLTAFSGQSNVDTAKPVISDFSLSMDDGMKEFFETTAAEIMEKFKGVDLTNLSVSEIFGQLKDTIGEELVSIMSNISLQFLSQAEVGAQLFLQLLNMPLDIPILSALYFEKTGQQLCLFDLFCFVASVMATVIVKIASGKNLCTLPQVEAMELAVAHDYNMDEWIEAWKVPAGAQEGPGEQYLPMVGLFTVVTVLHGLECIAFGLAVAADLKKIAPGGAITSFGTIDTFDFFDTVIDMIGAGVVVAYVSLEGKYNELPHTSWGKMYLSISITRMIIARGFDCAFMAYRATNKKEPSSGFKLLRAGIDTFAIGVVLEGLFNSLGLYLVYKDGIDDGKHKEIRITETIGLIGMWYSVAVVDFLVLPQKLVAEPTEAAEIMITRVAANVVAEGFLLARCIGSWEAYNVGAPDIGAGPVG